MRGEFLWRVYLVQREPYQKATYEVRKACTDIIIILLIRNHGTISLYDVDDDGEHIQPYELTTSICNKHGEYGTAIIDKLELVGDWRKKMENGELTDMDIVCTDTETELAEYLQYIDIDILQEMINQLQYQFPKDFD